MTKELYDGLRGKQLSYSTDTIVQYVLLKNIVFGTGLLFGGLFGIIYVLAPSTFIAINVFVLGILPTISGWYMRKRVETLYSGLSDWQRGYNMFMAMVDKGELRQGDVRLTDEEWDEVIRLPEMRIKGIDDEIGGVIITAVDSTAFQRVDRKGLQ